MVFSSPSDTPKAGDIIVRRIKDASRRYTLTSFGEVPQITCITYEEAIAQADRFARSHDVGAWLTDDGRTFARIVKCRQVSSV